MSAGDPYQAETDGVVVRVRPRYLADKSDPEAGRWIWTYDVEIVNLRPDTVQLMARRWTITDALGRVEEVRRPSVIGEQPVIAPGESHCYASGCPLGTSSGSMVGAYMMQDGKGRRFEARIPAFSLDIPGTRKVLN